MHHVRRVSRDESILNAFRRGASRQHVEALEPRRVMSAAVRAAVTDLVPPDLSAEQSPYYETSLVPDPNYHDRDDGLWAIGTYLKADHAKAFIGKVATLHGDALGDPSTYRASLTIDGVVSALPLSLRSTSAGIEVDVEASLPMGWHKFAVTITDDTGRTASTESAAFVTAPPIVGKGFHITAVAGGEFTGELAVFSGLKAEYIDDYVIGSNLPGSIASDLKLVHRAGDDAGTYRVVGKVSYATPGLYDTTVSLTLPLPNDIGELHSGGAIWSRDWIVYDRFYAADRAYGYWGGYGGDGASTDARGRAEVVEGRLAIDPELNSPNLTTNAGNRFSDTIARFDRLAADAGRGGHRFVIEATAYDARDYRGHAYDLTASMRISDESIEIVGDHVFGRPQTINYTVRIYDGDLQTGAVSGTLRVDHAIELAAERVAATEGETWTGRVATVRDDVFTNYDATYVATIRWGDDTTSAGTVVKRADGQYDVIGTHTYARLGHARLTDVYVQISRTLAPRRPGIESGSEITLGNVFNGKVGDVNMNRRSFVQAAAYDGFALSPDEHLTDTPGGWWDRIRVGESLDTRETSLAMLTVGRPTLLDGFTARIEWKDGVTEVIPLPAGEASGLIALNGKRRFDKGGQHSGTIYVSDGTTTQTFDVNIYVQDAPVSVAPPTVEYVTQFEAVGFRTLEFVKGVESEQYLGSIRSLHGADPADFTASAYAGVQLRNLRFAATETPGIYDVYATALALSDDDKLATTSVHLNLQAANGQHDDVLLGDFVIDVDAGLPDLTASWSPPFRQFEEFTTTLATFTFADRTANATDFTATIDWGDGTTSSGVITPRYKKHGFDITGTHLFRTDGEHPVRITVTGPNGSATTIYNMWTEHHPVDVRSTPAVPDGFRVSGEVATFTDGDLLGSGVDPNVKRINHAALIDWGDGTISTGDIVATGTGTFDVIGDHTYVSAGDYTVKVMVRQNAVDVPQLAARIKQAFTRENDMFASSLDLAAGQRDAFWAGVEQRISIRGEATKPAGGDLRQAGIAPIAFGGTDLAPPLAQLFTADALFDSDDVDVLGAE
jgi:hypothetical protein